MKIKTIDEYCNRTSDGPNFSTFLLGKDALLKLYNCISTNRMYKAGHTTKAPTVTLTGNEITALFEVCTELQGKTFQFSA